MLGKGFIRAIAVQPDGKIIIGGLYTLANGAVRNSLVRVNADGSLDSSFNTGLGPNSFVETISLRADGKVIVGGSFTSFNGVARNRIARLNADGSVDTSFEPGTGASSTVYAIALAVDNDLYVGGLFTSFNGVSRNRIVRLNEDGSVDTGFNPGTGASSTVYDVKLQPDGRVLIGGFFSSVNGVTRRRVARLNTDGSLDTSFVPDLGTGSASVYSLALQPDGKIIVGGYLADASFNPLAVLRLNTGGGVDNTFTPITMPDGTSGVNALRLQSDGKIVAVGRFNLSGRKNIARFNSNGAPDGTLFPGTGANREVKALALQTDGKILMGGDFYHFNGNTNDIVSVVRLNTDGLADSSFSFSTRSPGYVADLAALPNGKVIIVGDFLEINGVRQHFVARLNANGSLDTTFDQLYGTDASYALSLAVQGDGKLLVGGFFSAVGNAAHNNIARLNADGTVDSSFNTSADADVTDIKIQPDGKPVIGGYFQIANGATCNGIARLNSDGNLDMSFQQSPDILINLADDLTIQPDGKIIMGGQIFNSSFAPVHIVRLNANGTLDTSFNTGTGPSSLVRATAVQADGKILIGGNFSTVNGVSHVRLARLNANGSLDNSFNPGISLDGSVWAIVPQADGKILVGGYFSSVNAIPRRGVVRLNPDGSLDGTVNVNISGGVEAIGIQADGKILLGGYRLTPSTGILRILATATPFDFDGDGKTDVSVYRPSSASWYISQSSNGAFRSEAFGTGGDQIVPEDYDGDGKTDTAVFRPSTASWYFIDSSTGAFRSAQFGAAGDVPAPGDYDGDGKADIALFRPASGFFYLLYSSDGSFHYQQWGTGGDVPVMGDYDADGKTDFAIFRPSSSTFYILRSSDAVIVGQGWGSIGDKPVAADFDGDGKTDISVYRPSSGAWYYLQSTDGGFRALGWGTSGDVPAAGDYDGDGKWDVGVFRPSTGSFYILRSTNGALQAEQFGANGDLPVPAAYVP